MALHLNKLESPSPRDALCQSFVQSLGEINPVVLEKKIVNIDLPFGNDVSLHLNKLESPSPKDVLCQVWLKLALWF